jgi:hypothetical protein
MGNGNLGSDVRCFAARHSSHYKIHQQEVEVCHINFFRVGYSMLLSYVHFQFVLYTCIKVATVCSFIRPCKTK